MSKRDLNKAVNRRAILDAAAQIFARDGFSEANLVNIIELSGLATGTFYKYFDGKQALFDELTSELAQQIIQIINQAAASNATPELFIDKFIDNLLELFAEQPVRHGFVVKNMQGLRNAMTDNKDWRELLQTLKKLLENAIQANNLPVADAELTVNALLGAVSATLHYISLQPFSLHKMHSTLVFLKNFIHTVLHSESPDISRQGYQKPS